MSAQEDTRGPHVVRVGRPARQLVGKRFARLVVLARATSADSRSRWLCRCDCGNQKVVLGASLLDGDVKSCGCLRRETAANLTAKLKLAPQSREVVKSREQGVKLHTRHARLERAFDEVFKRGKPEDDKVDRPGARAIRGGRY